MTARGSTLAQPAHDERRAPPLHAVRGPAVRDRARRRRTRAALLVADLLALALAALATGRLSWLAAAPALALLARLHGLYDRDELVLRKTTLDEAPRLAQVAVLVALGLWLAHAPGATRPALVAFAVTLLAAAIPARAAARRATIALLPPERCLFVGSLAACERLRTMLAGPGVHAQLAACVPPRADDPAALHELLAQTDAERALIDPHALPPDEMLDAVRAAKALGLRVTLLPRVLDVVGGAVVFDDLDGATVLGVRRFGLDRAQRATKRAFDLAVALLALAATAPLMALIAAAIAIETGRPLLFRQQRVGRDGQPFDILKFRTMVPGAEARRAELRDRHGLQGDLFKLVDDPRVTRVGRLLRATSLDELPQLLNVVRGEMSIVGPRPLVLDEDAQITGWDRRRLHLTPGMTGMWQIAGAGRLPLAEMVKIDYRYVAGWSLWLDVRILLRTIPHVLRRRGL
jgi:exopolysaccharide biosynthesis polyprenyl glycosylphosphotransferase